MTSGLDGMLPLMWISRMTAMLLHAEMNAIALPDGIQRGLRPARLPRSDTFLARYESRILFYDVYWSADGRQIILQGPPPVDLGPQYDDARYICQPSGQTVKARAHHSSVVQLYSLDAPPGTTHVDIVFAGHTQRVAVGANHAGFFAGTNLLFTLSKDNDLAWIADWARFHVVNQGVDAVLLFDNMSTRYSVPELEAALLGVEGLKRIAVVPVPFTYPLEDRAVP